MNLVARTVCKSMNCTQSSWKVLNYSILFLAKALQCGFDSGQDLGINLRELHLLLLSSLVSVDFCSAILGVRLFLYMMHT